MNNESDSHGVGTVIVAMTYAAATKASFKVPVPPNRT